MTLAADAVVVGAGIAGVSTAYRLAVEHGMARVLIVDPRPPLTLTSDKSTECYRNWWPSRPMVGLMNHSIDLIDEMSRNSGDAFGLNRRGYLFVTGEEPRLETMARQAAVTSSFGADADILSRSDLLATHPYLTHEAVGGLRVNRAGWFSAQQLGAWMLGRARDHGVELVVDSVKALETTGGRISGVSLTGGEIIETGSVVVAAGPMTPTVTRMAGVDLPLLSELHLKVGFRDHLGVIPREAPMIIWADPQVIDWTPEEREGLEAEGRQDLLGEMPIFCHGRPEGGAESPYFLGLWEYHKEIVEPVWPIPQDPLYPEVVMRGLTTMMPGLAAYHDRLPESTVDGGYYIKTPENRPLIGPVGPAGLHVVAGLSGFGVMVSPGAADLVARHVTGGDLPDYTDAFLPSRYDDPGYLEEVMSEDGGQL
jgi:glycine/D-amino acid oxidase-like deaminating enzyme